MRFDEAGDDRAAAGIDDARAGSLVLQYGRAICDRNDFAVPDSYGFGAGSIGIHRQYAGVLDDQIGRWRHNFLPFELRLAEYWRLASRPLPLATAVRNASWRR